MCYMSLGRLKSVFVNKADPDQVALVRAAYQGLSCLRKKSRYEISDHTQVELVQYARAADSKMFRSLKTKRIQIRRLS